MNNKQVHFVELNTEVYCFNFNPINLTLNF